MATEWSGDRVRSTFIDYFVKKQSHVFVRSSPVVPHNDPTLLFTNAGMNQFKPVFLGQVDPSSPFASMKRATNTQKCIRAGGKHNDLDDVGKDVYHHTFFEMLGNWSFGDYFKQEAIDWAMDLLLNVYGLPRERLYATYFGGNEAMGLAPDLEAREIWLRHLPSSRVLPFGMKENFWEMGEVGPCGPCSEIHFDRIGGRDASAFVNCDDPNVLEIWNLVFIQFNRETDGKLKTLPAKHVDTGMGLERLTSVLQHKMSNYDTDLFQPLFEAIQKVTGARSYTGKVGKEDTDGIDMAYRVLADHTRTLCFAISDGAVPSRDGRGYVVRRILRRAVHFARQRMHAPANSLARLIPTCVNLMKGAFPEIVKNQGVILQTIEEEELQFTRTLDKGEELFEKMIVESKDGMLPGSVAFKLYDTYGFPVDLTSIMAEERGLKLDMKGYAAKMEIARELSRAVSTGEKKGIEKIVLEGEQVNTLQKKGIAATVDSFKYQMGELEECRVVAICAPDSGAFFVDSLESSSGFAAGVILEKTNFYAESGGQLGDSGLLRFGDGGKFSIVDVKSWGGYVVHLGTLEVGSIKVGDAVTAAVELDARLPTAANHTATHVLNFALRKTLGPSIEQKGSLVASDRLRFDFNHNGPVSPANLEEIENTVRSLISENLPVYSKVAELPKARAVRTLRAVFGETYPDPVRMVTVGSPADGMLSSPADEKWMQFSAELCGGTHLSSLSQAQDFAIITEEGIAKGIRRIVAFTRDKAKEAHREAQDLQLEVDRLATLPLWIVQEKQPAVMNTVKTATISCVAKYRLMSSLESLGKKLLETRNAKKKDLARWATAKCAAVMSLPAGGRRVIVDEVDAEGDGKVLSGAVDVIKEQKVPNACWMLFSEAAGDSKRVVVFCFSTDAAVDVKKWIGQTLEGSGLAKDIKFGGRADFAQGSFVATGAWKALMPRAAEMGTH